MLMLSMLIGNAQATKYFLQDDSQYTDKSGKNSPTDQGQQGSFTSIGTIASWKSATGLYYYDLTAKGVGNGDGGIDLKDFVLTIYTGETTTSTGTVLSGLVWQSVSSKGELDLYGGQSSSDYAMPNYTSKMPDQAPSTYWLSGGVQSDGDEGTVGTPVVLKGSGTLPVSTVDIDWLGLYNYDETGSKPLQYTADTQGEIKFCTDPPAVPEPASILLGIMGLSSLAGFGRFRKRTA
jgi:hypothetical protein